MEPRSFDALTRSLATPRTRRGFLGSLAALGAGLLGARAAGAAVTQRDCGNVVCAHNPGKCTAGCVCCTWSNGNSRCMPPGTCSGTIATTTTPAPTTTTTTTIPPCEGSQFACCSSTGVCTCCGVNQICDDGVCEGAG